MNAKFDSDDQPLCPECNVSLDCAPNFSLDIESMGGYSISYYLCSECHHYFELIENGNKKSIHPA
jgi:hypothetical protein